MSWVTPVATLPRSVVVAIDAVNQFDSLHNAAAPNSRIDQYTAISFFVFSLRITLPGTTSSQYNTIPHGSSGEHGYVANVRSMSPLMYLH